MGYGGFVCSNVQNNKRVCILLKYYVSIVSIFKISVIVGKWAMVGFYAILSKQRNGKLISKYS